MVVRVHVKNSNSQKDKRNKKGFMNHLTVEELIKAGAHFGHPTHRWNPNYKTLIGRKEPNRSPTMYQMTSAFFL